MTNKAKGYLSLKILVLFFWLVICLSFIYFYRFVELFSPADNVLNVYSFTAIIPKKIVEEFTKTTGIPVRITYFQTNEELFAKFNLTCRT